MSDQESADHSDPETKMDKPPEGKLNLNAAHGIPELYRHVPYDWRVNFTFSTGTKKNSTPWRTIPQSPSLVAEVKRHADAFTKPVADSWAKYASLYESKSDAHKTSKPKFPNALEAVACQIATFATWRTNNRSSKDRVPVYPALISALGDRCMTMGSDEVIAWAVFSLDSLVYCLVGGETDGQVTTFAVPAGHIAICRVKSGTSQMIPTVTSDSKTPGLPSALIFAIPSAGTFATALKSNTGTKKKGKSNENKDELSVIDSRRDTYIRLRAKLDSDADFKLEAIKFARKAEVDMTSNATVKPKKQKEIEAMLKADKEIKEWSNEKHDGDHSIVRALASYLSDLACIGIEVSNPVKLAKDLKGGSLDAFMRLIPVSTYVDFGSSVTDSQWYDGFTLVFQRMAKSMNTINLMAPATTEAALASQCASDLPGYRAIGENLKKSALLLLYQWGIRVLAFRDSCMMAPDLARPYSFWYRDDREILPTPILALFYWQCLIDLVLSVDPSLRKLLDEPATGKPHGFSISTGNALKPGITLSVKPQPGPETDTNGTNGSEKKQKTDRSKGKDAPRRSGNSGTKKFKASKFFDDVAGDDSEEELEGAESLDGHRSSSHKKNRRHGKSLREEEDERFLKQHGRHRGHHRRGGDRTDEEDDDYSEEEEENDSIVVDDDEVEESDHHTSEDELEEESDDESVHKRKKPSSSSRKHSHRSRSRSRDRDRKQEKKKESSRRDRDKESGRRSDKDKARAKSRDRDRDRDRASSKSKSKRRELTPDSRSSEDSDESSVGGRRVIRRELLPMDEDKAAEFEADCKAEEEWRKEEEEEKRKKKEEEERKKEEHEELKKKEEEERKKKEQEERKKREEEERKKKEQEEHKKREEEEHKKKEEEERKKKEHEERKKKEEEALKKREEEEHKKKEEEVLKKKEQEEHKKKEEEALKKKEQEEHKKKEREERKKKEEEERKKKEEEERKKKEQEELKKKEEEERKKKEREEALKKKKQEERKKRKQEEEEAEMERDDAEMLRALEKEEEEEERKRMEEAKELEKPDVVLPMPFDESHNDQAVNSELATMNWDLMEPLFHPDAVMDPSTTEPKFIDAPTSRRMTEECIAAASIGPFQAYFPTVFHAQLRRVESWLRSMYSMDAEKRLTSVGNAFAPLTGAPVTSSSNFLALVIGLPVPVDSIFDDVVDKVTIEPMCAWDLDTSVKWSSGDNAQRMLFCRTNVMGTIKPTRVMATCLGKYENKMPLMRVSFFNVVKNAQDEVKRVYLPISNTQDLDFMNLLMYVVASDKGSELREFEKDLKAAYCLSNISTKEFCVIQLRL